MFDNILSSKFYAVCTEFTRLLFATGLFILFLLPIVTFGASLTAFIETVRKSDYSTFNVFWESFKSNVLKGSVVMIFTGFTVMFLMQIWYFLVRFPLGSVVFIVVMIFMIVYNLNAYLFVSLLKKTNFTFFRQVYFFTIGTLYKTFFVPVIAFGFVLIAPFLGGNVFLIISVGPLLAIYVRLIKKDLETVEEYL